MGKRSKSYKIKWKLHIFYEINIFKKQLISCIVAVYSSAIQDNMNVILYPGLIEELVDIVEIKDSDIVVSKIQNIHILWVAPGEIFLIGNRH